MIIKKRSYTYAKQSSVAKVDAILEYIQNLGVATKLDVAVDLKMPQETARKYLFHMFKSGMLTQIQRNWKNKNIQYKVSTDEEKIDLERCVINCKAVNIGMVRDELVSALFGPGRC